MSDEDVEGGGRARTRGAGGGSPRWALLAGMALAALVLLILALGPGRRLWQGTHAAADAGNGGGVPELIGPAPGAAVGSVNVFTWHKLPGAQRYALELATPGGKVALGRVTADTFAVLSLVDLARGDYGWWVIALRRDGTRARSEMRALKLERR